jgi:2-polyprenyl-3-methyl-5-hydroxy-6-metoxy-1,4-benzoquinol methylase
MTVGAGTASLDARARQSLGRSAHPIYRTAADVLARLGAGGTLVDVGCGTGLFRDYVPSSIGRYIGVDAVRYDGLPSDVAFLAADLDRDPVPLDDASADVVVAIETIEHLENPRRFVRELVRVVRRGGWVIVTTPNQLSLLSLLTLAVRQRFSAFQDSAYPAHRTALLEVDLQRLAAECGLVDVGVRYTAWGRMPWLPWHYPGWLAGWFPRALSDNVLMHGRKP